VPPKVACCPGCGEKRVRLLTPSWKRYFNVKEFFISQYEWFAACARCGTMFRYPLGDYADFRKYGEDYYDQVNPGETVEQHAVWHYESFQKPNYDSLRSYLNETAPPVEAHRWLDVGSIGYVTTFDEYDFTTIEPDERIVRLGRRLFGPRGLSARLRPRQRIQCSTIEAYRERTPGRRSRPTRVPGKTPGRPAEALTAPLTASSLTTAFIACRFPPRVSRRRPHCYAQGGI